jgi:outer membrane receptor protein involved in Fe transport
MFYVSYATGFKAGGTNTDRISPLQSQLIGPETSTSFEVGLKADLGDNFRLSVAAFMTDYDDFQANAFDGSGFNLKNAGEIETQGLEIEALWQATDNLTIQSYYARNEGEYKTFEGATCWDATPFHTGVPQPTCNLATSQGMDW